MGGQDYYVHDNYTKPFRVHVTSKKVLIYTNDPYSDAEDVSVETYNILVETIDKYQDIFIGGDPEEEEDFDSKSLENRIVIHQFNLPRCGQGNSILVKVRKNKYIFIGRYIYSFTTKDEIVKYFSPVINDDIPCPYAIGTKYTYLMTLEVCMRNDKLTVEDPLDLYLLDNEYEEDLIKYNIQMMRGPFVY